MHIQFDKVRYSQLVSMKIITKIHYKYSQFLGRNLNHWDNIPHYLNTCIIPLQRDHSFLFNWPSLTSIQYHTTTYAKYNLPFSTKGKSTLAHKGTKFLNLVYQIPTVAATLATPPPLAPTLPFQKQAFAYLRDKPWLISNTTSALVHLLSAKFVEDRIILYIFAANSTMGSFFLL